MGPHRDAGKQQRWLDLVRRWQQSRLTVREFCRRHHLNEANFYVWRRVLRQRGLLAEAPHATPPFVQVTVAAEPAAAPVEVVLGDKRMLRVRPGFDPDLLRALVRLLEEPTC